MTQNEVWKKIGGNRKKDSYGPRFVLLERLKLIADLGTRICKITGRICHYYDVTSNLPPDKKPDEGKPRTFWVIKIPGYVGEAFSKKSRAQKAKEESEDAELIEVKEIIRKRPSG